MEGGKKYETKSWSFEREKEDLKILAVENHRFCFDITQIFNVVLEFSLTKHGIVL